MTDEKKERFLGFEITSTTNADGSRSQSAVPLAGESRDALIAYAEKLEREAFEQRSHRVQLDREIESSRRIRAIELEAYHATTRELDIARTELAIARDANRVLREERRELVDAGVALLAAIRVQIPYGDRVKGFKLALATFTARVGRVS